MSGIEASEAVGGGVIHLCPVRSLACVVRLKRLEIVGEREALPVEVHGARVRYDLPLIECGVADYSAGSAFFLSEMPTIAACKIFHAVAATSERGRAG